MGVAYAPQAQTYSSVPPSDVGNYGNHGGDPGLGGVGALSFGAPGADLQAGPGAWTGQGGKSWGGGDPNVQNQIPTGTPAPNDPRNGGANDPTLGMNAVYAPWNQLPGTVASGPAPDFSMSTNPTPTAVPQMSEVQALNDLLGGVSSNPSTSTMSGFGISPYFLGPYSYLGAGSSPLGVSPYWSSPFMTNSGKAMT